MPTSGAQMTVRNFLCENTVSGVKVAALPPYSCGGVIRKRFGSVKLRESLHKT